MLVDVQRRLECFYELEPGSPVTDFLISADAACLLPGGGSRTLVRQDGDDIALGVVLEDGVTRPLDERDPRERLDESNLSPFCTAAEEVSHFVYLTFCARTNRSITQLELELQGEVDKYLSSVFLLSLQNEGAVSRHLRDLLFHHWHLADSVTTPECAERYRTANDLAFRYCSWMEGELLRPARLPDLRREARRFYRLGQSDKLARIAALS